MVLLLAAIVALAGACSTGDDIGVDDPWAPPTAGDTGSFYAVFDNNSGETDLLIDGYSPACGRIEIHRTDVVDGTETMSRASAADLRVGNGDSLTFEPGGLHIMCIDMQEPFVEGQAVSLELTFESNGVLIFDVPIEAR
jgi:copper(I)-binding protein